MQGNTSIRLLVIGVLTSLKKPGLKIEAWDADAFFDDFIAEGISDAQGRCELSIHEDRYKEWHFDRDPDVYFKIYDGPRLILDTRESVLCNLKPGTHDIVLEIPEPKEDPAPKPEPSKPNARTISGRAVLSPEWEPGVVIEAFADAEELGFAETDAEGVAEIPHSVAALASGEGRPAIFVRVISSDGRLLATSPMRKHRCLDWIAMGSPVPRPLELLHTE